MDAALVNATDLVDGKSRFACAPPQMQNDLTIVCPVNVDSRWVHAPHAMRLLSWNMAHQQ